MICDPCKRGATLNSNGFISRADMQHANCDCIDCCCQHKTGPSDKFIDMKKVK